MIRHALAPLLPPAARALNLQRTLPQASGVALTFDDGPHPEGTPAILDLLARAGARAMFFVVGEQVARRPALVREVTDAGHLVALHAHRHRLQLRLTRSQLKDDLERGCAALEQATGEAPRWHRPPYGIYSAAGLAEARSRRLSPLLWSRWGKDWRRLTTPARIADRATGGIHSGDVILLHDADFYSSRGSHRRTAQALELILAELERRELATVLPS